MNLLKLAFKSLMNRRWIVGLTIACIAISVVLLLTLEKIKTSSEEGFTQTVSQVDLLVGARSGQLQLLLFSVFNIGNPTNNVSMESYQYWKKHPAVEWTIPYSLGDSFKGFRLVATNENFFKHYRFRQDQSIQLKSGRPFQNPRELVLGYEAYRELKLKEGDQAVVTHGVTHGAGVVHHDQEPFTIVGVMGETGMALDRAVYTDLDSMAHLHEEHDDHDHEIEEKHGEDHVPAITSFFIRTKNRIETLKLQREIAEFKKEALMAVIPSLALSELWQNLSYFEKALQSIIWLVALFSWITLLLMMLASMESRRREMALLRAMGAGPRTIVGLLVLEGFVVGAVGVLIGFVLSRLSFTYMGRLLKDVLGLQVSSLAVGSNEIYFMLAVLVGCGLVSFIPAWASSRRALKDGLTIKT